MRIKKGVFIEHDIDTSKLYLVHIDNYSMFAQSGFYDIVLSCVSERTYTTIMNSNNNKIIWIIKRQSADFMPYDNHGMNYCYERYPHYEKVFI